MLRSEMNGRGIKNDLSYCEDAVLDLVDLTVKINDVIKFKKMYEDVLQYENDSDTECESIEKDDYDVLSEDSDTVEIIGFRNM